MSPSWYDLLGIGPDAPAEEIRAAWKASIADLDPADRRFRLLNQAAEVLLDPTARAAYDATLVEVARTVVEVPRGTSGLETSEAESATEADDGFEGFRDAPSSLLNPSRSAPQPASDAPQPSSGRGVPGWVLAGVAVLTAVLVGLAAWLATQPSDASVADGTSQAQAAGEGAASKILSYDYRTMDEDQAAAGALMTADYRKEYDKLFSALEADAAEVKIQVTTELVASGITRSGADRVEVLVFVNRPTLNAAVKEPVVYRDQVTLTMENVDGDWLVDGMKTTPTSG